MAEAKKESFSFSGDFIDYCFSSTEEFYEFQSKIWGVRGNQFMAYYCNSLLEMTKFYHEKYDHSHKKKQ